MSAVSSSSTSSVLSTAASSLTSLALANSTALLQPTSDFFTNSFPQTASFGAASTSSAGNNDNDGNNNGNNNNSNSLAASSSLYLFTFLATLLLLLAISCAIVIRSFIIRRRFHRRVQEALADGSMLPPHAPGPGGFGGIGGGRRRDFGEKPKLWDAHLGPPPSPSSKVSRWEDIKPVSARILSDKLSGAGQRRVPSTTTTPPRTGGFLQTASLGLVNGHGRSWRPRFLPRPGTSQSPPMTSSTIATTPSAHPPTISAPIPPSSSTTSSSASSPAEPMTQSNSEDACLQIHVLIAMPSPYRPRTWLSSSSPSNSSSSSTDVEASPLKGKTRLPYPVYGNDNEDEEEELPDVAFGVAEVPWKVVLPSPPASQSQSQNQRRNESGNGLSSNGGEPSRGPV